MQYETVIGLETHAELKTESKMFCGCSTEFGAEPNTQTCPVCLGLPGMLPVINRRAFEYAMKAALALNCEIDRVTEFDRKNYYYPDLPKNYQISQNYCNLGVDGHLDMEVDGELKQIGIDNVHLEEDAGKLVHPEGADAQAWGGQADSSLVDLNRAGVPLLEIVTKPDMRSLEELEAYMQTLRSTLMYLGVSDCKMQEGSLRFEASISLREQGCETLGDRVEIKNLGSVKSVLRAVEYEVQRQTDELSSGGTIHRETRLWDEERGRSERMRSKEEAQDYRYFPEPDLLPVSIGDEWLEDVRQSIPELPVQRRLRFREEYGLSDYDTGVLTAEQGVADYFEVCLKHHDQPKAICNWVTNDVLRVLKEKVLTIEEFVVGPQMLADLARMVDENVVSMRTGREVFAEMAETGKEAKQIVEEKGVAQVSDESELETVVQEVVDANPGAVADFQKGKKKVVGFLMGQVMRATKGKANPQVITQILQRKLGGA